MIVHQVFAFIKNEKIVNVVVCDNYELANQLARNIYGKGAIAVDCSLFPVSAGDTYRDGHFYYKNGSMVEQQYTAEEETQLIKQQQQAADAAIAEASIQLAIQQQQTDQTIAELTTLISTLNK